tara:strand:+ start:835 stop:1812 length:978 start_codon:yes stop_codon:yes gene_type:complete
MTNKLDSPNFKDVLRAQHDLTGLVKKTPLMTSSILAEKASASRLWFKCENLQNTGSFKFRGATNALCKLSKEGLLHAVATHSSGNHGSALASAARAKGIPAHIVVPKNAPYIKKTAILSYGARVTECAPTLAAREIALKKVVTSNKASAIHPYNDAHVISGQGTVATEILDEAPDADVLLVPVGGGGLLSGCALAVKHVNPKVLVVGVEPKGADDAARSFKAGEIIPQESPNTVADGLLTSLGELNFPLIQTYVDDIVTVDDQTILDAMYLIWTRMKQLVEPSGAVTYAALLKGYKNFEGKKVVAVLSGGNVDPKFFLTSRQITS